MQHPPPGGVYPSFQQQPNSPCSYPHDSQSQEMGVNHMVHPGSSQPPNPAANVAMTLAGNHYSHSMAPDQRFLTNAMGALSQAHPSYFGPAPGPLPGISHTPYFPTVGFAAGNNYIGIINIESPTRPNLSKK